MSLLFQRPKDRRWYIPGPCPRMMRINTPGLPPIDDRIAVNFAGRGKVGLSCGGTDAYVTQYSDTMDVDVWAARRAGVWSSSTTILVYYAASGAVGARARTIQASPLGWSTPSTKGVTADLLPGCPATLLATVTVNDDGTWSIA